MVLAAVGAVLAVGLGAHAATAFATLDAINARSNLATPNAVVLFQDVATNGPRVPANVDAASRTAYGGSLTQFVLDGTGVCIGLTLAVAGLFVRANERL